MKFLIIISSILAATYAGVITPIYQSTASQAHGQNSGWASNIASYADHAEPIHQWTGPQHFPVIGHNGVPEDTKENSARRAFHHAAYAEAISRNGAHSFSHDDSQDYSAHQTSSVYGAHAEPIHQWTGPQHIPVIGHNGVPVDTEENNARRALHHAAYAKAVARNGVHAVHHDESQNYASYDSPASYDAHVEHNYQWTGPQHLPVIGHNGVPVDTKENSARRAFHHAAYAQAVSRNGQYTDGHETWKYAAHSTPLTNTQSNVHKYKW